ncbi:C40 family peptidase [Cellulomonas gelida]|uniref:NlpC/P60 domain-containing protein n=2 Tax=Cellulomonas TaxID=1707 RepID=A0A4Y3KMD5_9CELL|nr:C40 family peptidase [Cellulomonas gelida]GEA84544.1 hypothetical protein CGE01nite_17950 [Cellulomonas gelida]GGL17927.1 hypothetical protein GCM10009774_05330 [Cellulomonas gelida]
MRRARGASALAAATVGLLLVSTPGAVADPGAPSDDDVRQAQAAVGRAQRSVAEMEIRLAQLSSEANAAELEVQQAGEAYTQAMSDAQVAHDAAAQAQDRSDEAAAAAEKARRELVAIARQVARSGGSADLVEALLSAEGFEDVARRTSQMDQFTRKTDEAVQAYQATTLVAGTLAGAATQAADDATDAQAQAQTLLDAAQATADDAAAAQAAGEAERETLLAELATARQTSVDVERQRQAAIDEERRKREEEEARRKREEEQQPTPPPTQQPTRPPVTTPPPTTPTTPPPTNPTTPPPANPTTPPPANPTTPPPANPTTPPPAPTTPPPPKPTTPPSQYGLGTGISRGSAAQGQNAVAVAKTRLGAPYVWGGTGPGYDCSGLTMTSWRSAGVAINRTSRDQYKQVLKIRYADMRPGDLVFWGTNPNDPGSIYHVAMYIGGGQIIEAPRPGVAVRITSMRWAGSMPYAGRP